MTGYGAADGVVLGGRLQVEIRTVNHRHFNVQLKVPANLQHLDLALREREGKALAAELSRRIALIAAHSARVGARAPERLVAERDRLRRSVTELLDGRAMDENRLAQEIALIADRLDITEELLRLET